MGVIGFFLVCVAIWYAWIKFGPNNSDLIKVKFDYTGKKTAFYSKPKVIAAIVFWLFLLIVGITTSDATTTAIILGLISLIYAAFIVKFFLNRKQLKDLKKKATKVPGKIVGIKTKRVYNREDDHPYHTFVKLIVEYINPYTNQKEEYVPDETVNGNPFYYLRSMDVTVYYLDAEHIWVDDFERIEVLKDNLAYQLTGRVDGKDPGVLRYEKY